MSVLATAGVLAGPSNAATTAARVRLLVAGSAENLRATWDEGRALFPFSSRLTDAELVHDYEHPIAVRYTINSLLGLAAAARAGTAGVHEAEVHDLARRFLRRRVAPVTLPADHGLLTVLHAALGADQVTLEEQTRLLARIVEDERGRLNMQDLAWLLWGGAAAARAGVGAATDVVRDALALIVGDLVDAETGLPRHTNRRYRRNVVSFGSLVYFLRALHEAAAALGDEQAQAMFDRAVTRVLGFQGPRGEWPWMIDCRRGRPFDFYPVFAVHQDSMAMLFLHPALDRGLEGVREAIDRSVAWDFGANELATPMFVERPLFFAHRSIERTERAPQLRRYARSLAPPRVAAPDAVTVRVNAECRSYHLGWILFAWAGR